MQGNRETDKQKHTETGDVEETDTDKQDEEETDRLAKKVGKERLNKNKRANRQI